MLNGGTLRDQGRVATATVAAGAVITIGGLAYRWFNDWRGRNSHKEFLTLEPPAHAAEYLTPTEYAVFVALCDAFYPSLTEEEVRRQTALPPGTTTTTSPVPTSRSSTTRSDDSVTLYYDPRREDPNFVDKNMHILRVGALERDVHLSAIQGLTDSSNAEDRAQVALLLRLLSTTAGCLAITGLPAPFQEMSLANRMSAIRSLRDSLFADLRIAYQTFKRLITLALLSSYSEEERKNYFGYDAGKTANKTLREESAPRLKVPNLPVNDGGISLDADVVVVGSGAGGGVMAGELVKAGLRVVVLEKGGYYTSEDFRKWRETEASKNILERGGLVQSKTGSIAILAGSCVGGGTLVNWSASFKTPKFVLNNWAAEGLTAFGDKGAYHEHLEAVLKMFHVNTRFSYRDDDACCGDDKACSAECDPLFAVNANNKCLWRGAEAAGFNPERIPRNVKACVDCGQCGNGCPYNSKQSTVTTVLEPLGSTDFLTVVPHCNVTRVVRGADGYAEGVEGSVTNPTSGEETPIFVRAKVVVVACGALHTPALLLRSGFKNRKIGKHLALHPVAASAGVTRSTLTGLASGVSMGVVVRNSPLLERECDPGYGVAVETPPVYLNMLGLVLAWDSGLALKSQALLWNRTLAYLAISRDHSKESNRIEIDSKGDFEVHYDFTSEDAANVLNGLIQQLRIMRQSPDCVMLAPAHSSILPFDNLRDDDAFEAYISEVQREGIRRGKMEILSAHQMGSCKMAVSPDKGPVSPNGSLFECPNVFVSDASIFPTALGINPMMTVEAMSHMISRDVMKYLKVKPDRLVALPSEW